MLFYISLHIFFHRKTLERYFTEIMVCFLNKESEVKKDDSS